MRRCARAECKRRAARGGAGLCGPCASDEREREIGRGLAQLPPGGVLELGGGWRIVRAADDTGPGYMPRRTATMDFGDDDRGSE